MKDIRWQFLDTSKMAGSSGNGSWERDRDAMAAAPHHHRVLFENEEVRVLEVTILPGEKEEFHTHECKSLFIVDSFADMRYYGANQEVLYERPAPPPHIARTTLTWKEPEGLHAIENVSQAQVLHGIRIELK